MKALRILIGFFISIPVVICKGLFKAANSCLNEYGHWVIDFLERDE